MLRIAIVVIAPVLTTYFLRLKLNLLLQTKELEWTFLTPGSNLFPVDLFCWLLEIEPGGVHISSRPLANCLACKLPVIHVQMRFWLVEFSLTVSSINCIEIILQSLWFLWRSRKMLFVERASLWTRNIFICTVHPLVGPCLTPFNNPPHSPFLLSVYL